MRTITIPATYCGPPTSGNGGYTAGALAQALLARGGDGARAPVEVTLRAPAPLDRPLTVEIGGNGTEARLLDGDVAVADARRVPDVAVSDADVAAATTVASFADATALQAEEGMLRALDDHPFPTCFVCGPARHDADALRLFPVRIPGSDRFVAPYRPSVAQTAVELVWAALDCPSSFPMYMDEDPFEGPAVLGRMTARIDRRPVALRDHVVVAWREAVDGRKMHTACALVDDDTHAPVAVARATWIRIRS